MLNINQYRKTQIKLNECSERIKELNKLKEKTKNKYLEIQSNCEHLILCYDIKVIDDKIIKKAKCLVCNKNFVLNNTYNNFNEKYIIDITNKVSKFNINNYENDKSIFVIKAQETLEKIMSYNIDISLEKIKDIILNHLLAYDKELEYKRLILRNDEDE